MGDVAAAVAALRDGYDRANAELVAVGRLLTDVEAAVAAPTPPDPPGPVPTRVVRVNVGGPAVTMDGVAWEADRGFTGGQVSDQGTARHGPGSVYATERWGNFTYTFTGLPPGLATLLLHFAENHPPTDQPRERLFNVTVNGAVALSGYDIVAEAGGQFRPVVEPVAVTVPGSGRVEVGFRGGVNAATLHGLEALCYGTAEPGPEPPPVPAGTWLSGAGVYDPYAFGAWRGQPVEVWETWNKHDTWPQMRAIPSVHQYFTGAGAAPFNRRFPGRMSFSQPLWALGENAAKTASGANDDHFRTVARALVAAGYGDAYIRLGWEQNGNWFWWHATNANTDDWVKGFRRVYGIFKAESSAFRVVWNPNKSSNYGYDVRKSFPGSGFCDLVGVDLYNMYPPAHDQAGWDAAFMQRAGDGSPIGPGAWMAYARELGLPICWPEWSHDWGDGNKATHSGDDVVFIRNMRERVFAAGGTEYESLFNLGAKWNLYQTTHYPNSAAEYRRLWAAR